MVDLDLESQATEIIAASYPPSERAKREAAYNFVFTYLSKHPCVDCGVMDVFVLEFDHVGMKHANVGTLAAQGASTERILAEIAMCDVVCRNCHAIRTHTRAKDVRYKFAMGLEA